MATSLANNLQMIKIAHPIHKIKVSSSASRNGSRFVRASSEDASSTTESPTPEKKIAPKIRTSAPGRSFAAPPPPSASQPSLKLQKVEKLESDAIAGVAAVERSDQQGTNVGAVLKLVVGDTAAFLIFASIGRLGHHEALSLTASFETALPFLMGWFVAAPLLGGFSRDAQGGNVGSALGAAAKSWALAIPLGIAVRSVMREYVPDKSFVIVSFVATAVLLLGWRAAAAALTQEEDPSQASKKNKAGNPFEFFTLLASLVKRW